MRIYRCKFKATDRSHWERQCSLIHVQTNDWQYSCLKHSSRISLIFFYHRSRYPCAFDFTFRLILLCSLTLSSFNSRMDPHEVRAAYPQFGPCFFWFFLVINISFKRALLFQWIAWRTFINVNKNCVFFHCRFDNLIP
jgi:hypothetical protein